MISCTDFIAAYSELFHFLEKKGGKPAVKDFWNYLSDLYLASSLKTLVKQHGIRGCWEYWEKVLDEEAADCTMEMDEEAGVLTLQMHHCPSKGRLLEWKHITPYPDYCGHCDVLYQRVLEPLGFRMKVDLSETDKARCKCVIRKTR